ncbi:hypothetical protein [Shewanella surugensis]|uniref:Uncharacterized protein n=1 Tax=Shewanella surugensis TaxID=212020 RepID=A0ABT0LJA9_9GAMM|nr:hypothetical protein [Shewanella surugensis]MCL1127763.1 hypothetical protein [Shewanella surugensis]
MKLMKNKKTEKLKEVFCFLIGTVIFLFFAYMSIGFLDVYNSVGEASRIKVGGLLNNISVWVLSGFFFFVLFCLLYKIIQNKVIWLPIGTFLLIFSITGGIIGLVLDSMTREKVKELGYQECRNEAYFSRNASYKIFVLSQADCEVKK